MISRTNRTWCSMLLAAAPVIPALLFSTVASAGGPPPGWPSGVWPYNVTPYQSYQHKGPASAVLPHVTAGPPRSPTYSGLKVYAAPYKHTDDPSVAYVIAHVPVEAEVLFFDFKTSETGNLRTFKTQPIPKDGAYYYVVTVRWIEDGQWVSQIAKVSVAPGETYCVDVIHTNSPQLAKDIEVAIAKLPGDDAAAAKKQKNCAVQEGVLLGSMGAPTKIMVKGEAVFICCPACEEAAKKDPDKVLQTAKKLREAKDSK